MLPRKYRNVEDDNRLTKRRNRKRIIRWNRKFYHEESYTAKQRLEMYQRRLNVIKYIAKYKPNDLDKYKNPLKQPSIKSFVYETKLCPYSLNTVLQTRPILFSQTQLDMLETYILPWQRIGRYIVPIQNDYFDKYPVDPDKLLYVYRCSINILFEESLRRYGHHVLNDGEHTMFSRGEFDVVVLSIGLNKKDCVPMCFMSDTLGIYKERPRRTYRGQRRRIKKI